MFGQPFSQAISETNIIGSVTTKKDIDKVDLSLLGWVDHLGKIEWIGFR